ncbi:MAG TPA: hypothetical protein VJZ93_02595 [Candidatus Nanoarchaeia archaeon]|nr:hypothetical protein [Candidatus Nanoarchaeia archaeon]
MGEIISLDDKIIYVNTWKVTGKFRKDEGVIEDERFYRATTKRSAVYRAYKEGLFELTKCEVKGFKD